MYKKIILFGACAIAFSTVTLADEGGYGASSIASGAYLGGQFGLDNMHYGNNAYQLIAFRIKNLLVALMLVIHLMNLLQPN